MQALRRGATSNMVVEPGEGTPTGLGSGKTRLDITNADFEDYRSTHSRRQVPSPFARKPSEDY